MKHLSNHIAIQCTAGLMFALAAARPSMGGTLLSFDFNGPNPWPSASTDVLPSTPIPVEPSIDARPVGTVDVANSTTRSGGMCLSTQVGSIKEKWEATFISGLLPVKNVESDLGKLALAFDLSASAARPVNVRITSFGENKRLSGSLEGSVLPAAPGFYQRMVLDLSSMIPVRGGHFKPTDPFVQIELIINGPSWPSDTTDELLLDNVNYSSATLYVSPKGSDNNDGLSEAHPLADPQKAVDLAKPGDIVLLMDGEYHRGKSNTVQDGIVAFHHTGTPAAWITLKNYPGHHPVLRSDAWNAVQIRRSKEDSMPSDPVLAYLEVRGLHVLGMVDEAKSQHADEIGKAKPSTNGNGISVGGDGMDIPPHHIRIADNLVERCAGGGIGAGDADWMFIEHNISRDNCWTTIYAPSGISLLGSKNFDGQDNVYKWLIRDNITSGNRTYVAWNQVKRISDGNGIIIDTNVSKTTGEAFSGRTLIQNNISFNNGGSGIHSFRSHRIDVVNNTAFMNGASPELRWGQIFFQRADDVHMYNNVLVAREGQPVNTVSKETTDQGNTHMVRANNVYFGGGIPPIMGENDVVADPKFIKPSTDFADADFRLASDSPAIGHGQWSALVPVVDIQGRPRSTDANPDAGALQHLDTLSLKQ